MRAVRQTSGGAAAGTSVCGLVTIFLARCDTSSPRRRYRPEFAALNWEDPTALILSTNIHHRHMTKGRRPMAVAKMYPEPRKGGSGKMSTVSAEFVSSRRISHAHAVVKFAPGLAEKMWAGAASPDDAHKTARVTDGATTSDGPQVARRGRGHRRRASDPPAGSDSAPLPTKKRRPRCP